MNYGKYWYIDGQLRCRGKYKAGERDALSGGIINTEEFDFASKEFSNIIRTKSIENSIQKNPVTS